MEQERARRNELAAVFGYPGVLDLPVAADVTWGRITVTAGS